MEAFFLWGSSGVDHAQPFPRVMMCYSFSLSFGVRYTLVMKKIKENLRGGETSAEVTTVATEFARAETARINGLLKGKLTEAKLLAFEKRLNILASFALVHPHDEL